MYTLPMESDPYFSLALVAHEAAHKIGPRISYINNYDLQRSYEQLLDCYRDPRSLGALVNNQTQDEIVADYISSEVVARELAQLPENQKKSALLAVMKNYCLWGEDQGGFLNIKAVHPPNELRISAIFGANPNLRAQIGCKKDSLNYKSCGIKNLIQTKKERKDKSSKDIDRVGVQ